MSLPSTNDKDSQHSLLDPNSSLIASLHDRFSGPVSALEKKSAENTEIDM